MKTHILHALSEKSFLYLWLGEVFTQISIHLFNFFAIFMVFKATQSNTAVSGVIISFTIPAILFGSIAGAYVDKWDKKKVLIAINLLRAVLLLALAFSIDNIFVLYVIGFLVAVLTQFFIPAETPMIPHVVHKNHLLSANALFGMGIYGSILIAYVLSGSLLLILKPVNTLLFLVALLVIGAVFIAFIKPRITPKKKKDVEKVKFNIVQDLKHTLSFMSKAKQISSSLFFLALSQILILVVATIAPGYASEVLNISVEQFSLFFVAPAALGVVIGAVVLVNVFHSHKKAKVINVGLFMAGIAMLLLPYGSKVASRGFVQTMNSYLPPLLQIDVLHIIVALAFFLGVANAFIFVPANTIIQEETADEIRGKIYGFLNTFVGILSLLPIVIVGGLSDLIGVGAVIIGIGLSILGFGVVRLFLK